MADELHSFASITELKRMGIHVAPSTASVTTSAIDFESGFIWGRLQLSPEIFTQDDSSREYANMMAYEFITPGLNRLPAVAYINFMKSLINQTQMTSESCAPRRYCLPLASATKKVVEIVNGMATFGVTDYSVYNHVRKRWQTWMAELIQTKFRSPWTVIAFVAAFLLLALAFIQTYFTVYPPDEKKR